MRHFVVGVSHVNDKKNKHYVQHIGETTAEPINSKDSRFQKWSLKFNKVTTTKDITEARVFTEDEREVIDFKHLDANYVKFESFVEEVFISPNKPVSEPLATSEAESGELTFYLNHHTELTSKTKGSKVWANLGRVDIMFRVEDEGTPYTRLILSSGQYLEVFETPEEIRESAKP